MSTYRPLPLHCTDCTRYAEPGMWIERGGTRHHYCWLCYRKHREQAQKEGR